MPTRISLIKGRDRPTVNRSGFDTNMLQVFTSAACLGKGKIVIRIRELLKEQHTDPA